MTVIVALKDKEKGVTIIGGDSRRSHRNLVLPLPVEKSKVFVHDGIGFGHTGPGRIRHLTSGLEIKFTEQGPSADFDLETALLNELIPAFKARARKLGFISEEKGKIPDLGGQVLVAVGTQICVLHNDLSLTPIAGDFFAIGSGQQIALGALHVALEHTELSTEESVLASLRAATEFVGSVGEPFVIKRTRKL